MKPNAKIHFIGIGGIGMSGIAQILLSLGYVVSGSDANENQETDKLKTLGARIFKGHAAEQVEDATVVVVSSAISPSNPELVRAKEKKLTILPRAEMLAELMRKKKSIVVAGSHGKSTTSAMITTLLLSAKFDPTAVIGGRLRQISGNAKMGTDDWFVAESDESDGSFLHLLPFIAVVTNIDREHMDHYGSMTELRRCFVEFVNRVPFDGLVVLCADHEETLLLGRDLDKRVMWYGINQKLGIYAQNIKVVPKGVSFEVYKNIGESPLKLGDITLSVGGRHNILNSLAAITVGMELEVPWPEIEKGMMSFTGIDRRLEVKGTVNHITVVDDYAHHPTEIKATLAAIDDQFPQGQKWIIFQPHRYSRLKDLWNEFVHSFRTNDKVCVLPIYAASESPIVGIDGATFARELQKATSCEAHYFDQKELVLTFLKGKVQAGDVIITMGAGDVTYMGPKLLEIVNSP